MLVARGFEEATKLRPPKGFDLVASFGFVAVGSGCLDVVVSGFDDGAKLRPPNGFVAFVGFDWDALGCVVDVENDVDVDFDVDVDVDPKSGFDDEKLANGFDAVAGVDDAVEVGLEPNAGGAVAVVVFVAVLGTKLMVPNGFFGFVLDSVDLDGEADGSVEAVVEKPPNGFDCVDDDTDDAKFMLPKGFLADVVDSGFVVFVLAVCFGFCGEEEDIDNDPRVDGRESLVDVGFAVAFVVVLLVGRGLSLGRGDPNHRSRLAFHEARSCLVCLVSLSVLLVEDGAVDVGVPVVVDAGKVPLLLLLSALSRNRATGFTKDDAMVVVAVDGIGMDQRGAELCYD